MSERERDIDIDISTESAIGMHMIREQAGSRRGRRKYGVPASSRWMIAGRPFPLLPPTTLLQVKVGAQPCRLVTPVLSHTQHHRIVRSCQTPQECLL